MTYPTDKKGFSDVVELMALLRSENGCPWDREQDHESLKKNLIEETYEVIEAIDAADDDELKEELGDLLLQIVFHSQIAAEAGRFDVMDVTNGIHEKITRRHPHLFGESKAKTTGEVLKQWEDIKRHKEGKDMFASIPRELPALQYAQKVQEKAARVGFDWPDQTGVLEKIREEVQELIEAESGKDRHKIEEETGDLIFALVNYIRHNGLDAEQVLRRTVKKFRSRFMFIEEALLKDGLTPSEATLEQLEMLWQKSKEEKNA